MNKSTKAMNRMTLGVIVLTTIFVSFFAVFLGLKINAEQKSMETSAFLGGGTGKVDDPWIIKTEYHLKQFADAVNNGNSYAGRYFKLDANIDFRDERESVRDDYYMTFHGIGTFGHASDEMWNHSVPFCGHFDGGGHTIQGFYINNNEYAVLTDHTSSYEYSYDTITVGFFAALGKSASVTNLRLANFELICGYQKPANANGYTEIYQMAVGGIAGAIVAPAEVGQNAGELLISNCVVENMKITKRSTSLNMSEYHVGGLVGSCIDWSSVPKTQVSNCYLKNISVDNNMYGSSYLFGGTILGTHFENGSVSNCILTGTNTAPNQPYFSFSDVGGLGFECSTSNVYLTPQSSYALSSVDSTSGASGTTWYRHSDYNSGVPYLRLFISWKTVTFNAVNGTVSKESIVIPSDVTKRYSSSSSSITVVGETITSSGNSGFTLCRGWTCNSPTSYTVTYDESCYYLNFNNLRYSTSNQSDYAPQCSTFISGTTRIKITDTDSVSVSVQHAANKTIITYNIGSHIITYEVNENIYTIGDYGDIVIENPLLEPGDGPVEKTNIELFNTENSNDTSVENIKVVLPEIDKYLYIDIENLYGNYHRLEVGEVYYINPFLELKSYNIFFN